ncbi:hypothetical protein DM860_016083 [Cuscuta australis]|uniref:Uncharacterized protein n=1 Tax=Cuscuta australis TaxID=267555 RepID=A0A328E2J1_9ASTE|nr:hypothetical protein DM860_016083 [Cuscuta australis]
MTFFNQSKIIQSHSGNRSSYEQGEEDDGFVFHHQRFPEEKKTKWANRTVNYLFRSSSSTIENGKRATRNHFFSSSSNSFFFSAQFFLFSSRALLKFFFFIESDALTIQDCSHPLIDDDDYDDDYDDDDSRTLRNRDHMCPQMVSTTCTPKFYTDDTNDNHPCETWMR